MSLPQYDSSIARRFTEESSSGHTQEGTMEIVIIAQDSSGNLRMYSEQELSDIIEKSGNPGADGRYSADQIDNMQITLLNLEQLQQGMLMLADGRIDESSLSVYTSDAQLNQAAKDGVLSAATTEPQNPAGFEYPQAIRLSFDN